MKILIQLIMGSFLVGVIHVGAATIPVTNTGDNGVGSLRAALANAADGDTITFSVTTPATITLTTGELLVTNSLSIVGLGPNNLAVDGNAASRVFHIQGGVTAAIFSLTISNGHVGGEVTPADSGGGIFNDHSTLTVSNCSLSGNLADGGGGILNDGKSGNARLTVIASTISNNSATFHSGAIWNDGEIGGSATLTVVDSTISGNSAVNYGGGILNDGFLGSAILETSNCTFSGNAADIGGGGIYNDGATLEVGNCTFSDNEAGLNFGGGIVNDGSGDAAMLRVSAATFSGNLGSAIVNFDGAGGSAIVEIGNTILNAGASGVNITNWVGGTVTSHGYNLSSDNGGGFLTAIGDQINTDPMLGPLQDNGGPTFTHALLAGSPCIDAGDPNFTPPPDFDQRGPGFPRVVSGRIDIGAFEVQFVADSDGDGVPDSIDQCPNTPSGSIVNATGCSIAQLVPCDGPASGGKWKSHGQYVQAVVKAATDFLKTKLITRKQWMEIVTCAAWSKCGWNRRCDHDWDRDWHRNWDCDRDHDWGRGRNWDRD